MLHREAAQVPAPHQVEVVGKWATEPREPERRRWAFPSRQAAHLHPDEGEWRVRGVDVSTGYYRRRPRRQGEAADQVDQAAGRKGAAPAEAVSVYKYERYRIEAAVLTEVQSLLAPSRRQTTGCCALLWSARGPAGIRQASRTRWRARGSGRSSRPARRSCASPDQDVDRETLETLTAYARAELAAIEHQLAQAQEPPRLPRWADQAQRWRNTHLTRP